MKRLSVRMKKKLSSCGGQTFILVMTVTALATVLGVMAMSAALMSVRLRSMKRLADKNFYRLELAAEEIRAGVMRDVVETAGDDETDWQARFLGSRVGIHDLSALAEENAVRMNSRREAIREDTADYLASFSATIPAAGSVRQDDRTEELVVTVEGVRLDAAGEIVFSDTHFTLINYERDAQSEVICDLVLTMPADGARRVDEVVRIENWRRIG